MFHAFDTWKQGSLRLFGRLVSPFTIPPPLIPQFAILYRWHGSILTLGIEFQKSVKNPSLTPHRTLESFSQVAPPEALVGLRGKVAQPPSASSLADRRVDWAIVADRRVSKYVAFASDSDQLTRSPSAYI